ncbi:putative Toll/interleukin-1 receptor domain-containing protein [Tanacetum coccineum]
MKTTIAVGSDTIEGLALDMQKVDQRMRSEALALTTGSFAKMDKLRWLQLKNVELTGSYKNFPELRWLCWHWCHLQIIPSGLLMRSLVAIDMSYGELKKFEPPMVLSSLKILNLKGCKKLVSICNLDRLPKLDTLILWYCTSLADVCKTIGGLKNLAKLNLTGCKKLFRALSDKKYVKPERVKALRIGGGTPKEPLFSLPMSLKYLYIGYCEFEYKNDLCVVFHAQSFFYLSLRGNLFESLPNNIDLKMLRVLNLNSCPNLKSIVCLPNTLENLYTHWCTSLEKITFQSACFSLKKFGYDGCFKLSEIQGLLKLVPIASLDESDLGNMKWIKEYEAHKVDLVGDVITKGIIWHTQMLYEYGIRSTYLQGIKDKSMMSFEYTTSSLFLSFHVPLFPEKRRLQGLNISILYTSSGEDKDYWLLFAKISNRTKVEQEENFENNAIGEEEIGGDLSEFEVTTGGYYLCRHDFFRSRTSHWLKYLFDDTVHYSVRFLIDVGDRDGIGLDGGVDGDV